jgi:hypothetical protein
MYLVSDLSHKPVSTFDDADDAIACITSWYQRSVRHITLESIPGSTIEKVVPLEDPKQVLGYITSGVPHNPSVVRY